MTQPNRRRPLARGLACALVSLPALLPACLNRPLETAKARTTTVVNMAMSQTRVDKIDILLGIDDSKSMADKQAILAVAVPDLVGALVNPPCIDAEGQVSSRPESPLHECPDGSRRQFEPVLDIHVGILSTSLGPRGGTMTCSDDDAMLLSRVLEGAPVDTFQDKGFLAWQPEANEPAPGLHDDPEALIGDLQQLVVGVGQEGCGYEAQLESWYRFLVDPNPYAALQKNGSNNVPVGTDDALLAQRAAFLRPDSLVAIVMLSDENDCSFRAEGLGYLTATPQDGGMFDKVARSVCASDPDDPCCTPCGEAPAECPTDPACSPPAPTDSRLYGLTCFEQKRRYGTDLLYPTERYVAGLRERQISDRNGNLVDNPLLVSKDGLFRGDDMVYLTGIVGVPWQLVARDPSDLSHGLKNADELKADDTWSTIAGDPSRHQPPHDPHMVESIHPRAGLPGPDSPRDADPIHGHELEVFTAEGDRGDLQYACVFELPEPFECTESSCDCSGKDTSHNPLCQDASGAYGTTQFRAKAYPSLRQLAVLKGAGSQGIVGSICPAQIDDPEASDFGYRPAIEALVDRLSVKLSDPCLPRALVADPSGQVSCLVLEGRALEPGESCSCEGAGRGAVTGAHQASVNVALSSPEAAGAELDCFCEIEQLRGPELGACQSQMDDAPSVDGEPVDGWCYVDASIPGANEQLVAHCPVTQEHTLRFVGDGRPMDRTKVFITCQQESGS